MIKREQLFQLINAVNGLNQDHAYTIDISTDDSGVNHLVLIHENYIEKVFKNDDTLNDIIIKFNAQNRAYIAWKWSTPNS